MIPPVSRYAFARSAFLLLTLGAAACDSPLAPTAPPPAPILSVSHSALELSRTSTTQITATSSLSNVPTDVTASTIWRTDNPEIATVSAGLIFAVGPGTTNVSAEHAGQTKTIAVTVRRRVFLRGSVAVKRVDGSPRIEGIAVMVDGQDVGGNSPSGRLVVAPAPIGQTSVARPMLEPGGHLLALRVVSLTAGDYRIRFAAPLRLLDADTGEEVGTVSVENRDRRLGTDALITWPLTIQAYTS